MFAKRSRLADLKQAASRWWAERLQRDEARDAFQSALAKMVRDDMEISTDYDPDTTLCSALRSAGVHCAGVMFSCEGLFPRKTMMVIRKGTIKVGEGYAAHFHQIFP